MARVMLGRTLSHYRILEKLGAGGMGEVYVAEDTRLGRKVALKILPQAVADSAERRRRFEHEARAVASLSHPNVLGIHDFDEDDGILFAVTELLQGSTLRDRLASGAIGVDEALDVARQTAKGLAAAHAKGVVHRDLKPENLFLCDDGHVKILDFGLAKRGGEADAEAKTRTRATEPGAVMGTVGYMSPEQAKGEPTDHRTDFFSFGAILYEMVSGRRAFERASTAETLSAILNEEPPAGASGALDPIVRRCLRKRPEGRWRDADELVRELDGLARRLSGPAGRPRYSIALVSGLAVALLLSVAALVYRSSERRRAREELVPQIARLAEQGDAAQAFVLLKEAKGLLTEDPVLTELEREVTFSASISSEPEGAEVAARAYGTEDPWQTLGETPLVDMSLPRSVLELRLRKAGFGDVTGVLDGVWKFASFGEGSVNHYVLTPREQIPTSMIRVPTGAFIFMIGGLDLPPDPLGDYWIDRHEVTNGAYKRFVDAGGYEKREFWKHPFVKNGQRISWEEAMKLVRDATGRAGPSSWELGDFPEGKEDFPVTGVSWYEAAAYAEYVDKSLPTLYHWAKAASHLGSGYIVPHSNFDNQGPAPVGFHRGVSEYGVYDVAGNAREWCWNEASRGGRFLMGGGWNDEAYWFNDANTSDPFDRSETNGFRCMRAIDPLDDDSSYRGVIDIPYRDYGEVESVSEEVFAAYRRLYDYDPSPLNAEVDRVDATSPDWTRERVTFDAVYGGERMVAYLFIPKNGDPPFQPVVHFPGAMAVRWSSIDDLPRGNMERIQFIVKGGRALVYPIYRGTFERRTELARTGPNETNAYKEYVIHWAKDLRRAIDYVETREDLDAEKVGYYGTSWGGSMGPIMLAVEERLKAGVLYVAGLQRNRALPEVDVVNFLPRVRVPVLMLNGSYDALLPVDAAQEPFFELLGTPDEHKRRILYDTGHFVPRHRLIRETLDWFDRYLGPVN